MQGAGLEASWHKMPTRHLGTDPQAEYVNLLLLPWPLRVRESDFRGMAGSVQRLEREALDELVRAVLRSTLEQLSSREAAG